MSIENTRFHLNQDSNNTNQDFTAYASQAQQDAERSNTYFKRFVDEVQRAFAQNANATLFSSKNTQLINLKETSVDKGSEDVSRADYGDWIEGLYVHLHGIDGWNGISVLLN